MVTVGPNKNSKLNKLILLKCLKVQFATGPIQTTLGNIIQRWIGCPFDFGFDFDENLNTNVET